MATMEETIEQLLRRIGELQQRLEVVEGRELMPAFDFVDLPVTMPTRSLCIVRNGRKDGEGGGAGTGVVAMWHGAPVFLWKRTSDYTAVAV